MNDEKVKKMRVERPNLDENQAYLTRSLDHYNAWLMDRKRNFTDTYPGFPEELKPAASEKRKKTKKVSSIAMSMKKKIVRERSKRGEPTKQERAVQIVELNPKKEEAINAIQTQLNMSKAGATTYYYNSVKILGRK